MTIARLQVVSRRSVLVLRPVPRHTIVTVLMPSHVLAAVRRAQLTAATAAAAAAVHTSPDLRLAICTAANVFRPWRRPRVVLLRRQRVEEVLITLVIDACL